MSRTFRSSGAICATIIDTLVKLAEETVTYQFDFSLFLESAVNNTITSAVVPAVPGLTIGSPSVTNAPFDGVSAGSGITVSISGGTAWTTYTIECIVTFASGSIRAVKGKILCK